MGGDGDASSLSMHPTRLCKAAYDRNREKKKQSSTTSHAKLHYSTLLTQMAHSQNTFLATCTSNFKTFSISPPTRPALMSGVPGVLGVVLPLWIVSSTWSISAFVGVEPPDALRRCEKRDVYGRTGTSNVMLVGWAWSCEWERDNEAD